MALHSQRCPATQRASLHAGPARSAAGANGVSPERQLLRHELPRRRLVQHNHGQRLAARAGRQCSVRGARHKPHAPHPGVYRQHQLGNDRHIHELDHGRAVRRVLLRHGHAAMAGRTIADRDQQHHILAGTVPCNGIATLLPGGLAGRSERDQLLFSAQFSGGHERRRLRFERAHRRAGFGSGPRQRDHAHPWHRVYDQRRNGSGRAYQRRKLYAHSHGRQHERNHVYIRHDQSARWHCLDE